MKKYIRIFMKFKIILVFVFLLTPLPFYGLIIYEIAKVECIIIKLYDNYIPDDEDKPEILKVSYIAEAEIIKVIPDKNNLDPAKIYNLIGGTIRINSINFNDSNLKESFKDGMRVIGYLTYDVVEYHQYGYKVSISLVITKILDAENDIPDDNITP